MEEHAATVTTVAAMPTLIMTKEDRTMILKRARAYSLAPLITIFIHDQQRNMQPKKKQATKNGSMVKCMYIYIAFSICRRRDRCLIIIGFYLLSQSVSISLSLSLTWSRFAPLLNISTKYYINKNKCNNFWYSALAS